MDVLPGPRAGDAHLLSLLIGWLCFHVVLIQFGFRIFLLFGFGFVFVGFEWVLF